jgi:hypothetical protein
MTKTKAPTVEQKIMIYERVLEYLPVNIFGSRYICVAINHAQCDLKFKKRNGKKKWLISGTDDCLADNFPELLAYKPKNKKIGEPWWSVNGYKANSKRIRVVNEILAELRKQL